MRGFWRLLVVIPLLLATVMTHAIEASAYQATPVPAEIPMPPYPLPSFFAGFSVYIYGNHVDARERSAEILDRLQQMHVNSVSLTFFFYQEDWTSSELYLDESSTPSKETLAAFIEEAHQRQMVVMLRPVLEEAALFEDDQWRGSIEPVDRMAWFQSYEELLLDYARFAQLLDVEIFNIGTELTSMERDVEAWRALIQRVRDVYTGQITYSFNWEGGGMRVEAPEFGFTGQLDFVGVDAYFPLNAPAGATVSELVAAWRPWMEQLASDQAAIGKTIVITEIGTRSQAGSYITPWLWTEIAPESQADQANYFASFCSLAGEGYVRAPGAALVSTPAQGSETIRWLSPGMTLTVDGPIEEHGVVNWRAVIVTGDGERGYLPNDAIDLSYPVGGMYVWAVDFNQGVDIPASDVGFVPLDKLAEPVITSCFARLSGTGNGGV